jgi:uncharacterized membrane protein (DUF485 family)
MTTEPSEVTPSEEDAAPEISAPEIPAPRTSAEDAPPPPEFVDPTPYLAVAASPEFDGLRKAMRGFAFPVTIGFFLWYALYVVLSAYARGFMGTKVVGNINVAVVFGLLQFVSTFLIAWAYARHASRKLDPVADELRARVESGGQS